MIGTPATNSTFVIGWVSCSLNYFVVTESSVHRMSNGVEKPVHHNSANR